MKICWDNLNKLKYTSGKWNDGNGNIYIEMDSCKTCCEPYLTNTDGDFCTIKCSNKRKNNPNLGRKYSYETLKKFSESKKRENHPNWKGGYRINNIPCYDIYEHKIEYAEQVRRNKEDKNILEVKCAYCGKWHIPKMKDVEHRIDSLNGKRKGESRFYCSIECKKECPIYHKQKYSAEENNTNKYSREVQPELRQMVFERDNWTCQKCDSEKNLHCHHVEGIRYNPLESADVDMCVTLCKKCHKQVHKKEGCGYKDMKCKVNNE